MPDSCLLYYITDRTAFLGDESERRRRLLGKIAEAARAGIDYIQLREKDLTTRQLESLAAEAVRTVRQASQQAADHEQRTTALLINSRTDVALAVGADGVHLRSNDISPEGVREASRRAGAPARQLSPNPLIAVSCHSPAEVAQAATSRATFAVFAPVFEKRDSPEAKPAGLTQLHEACRTNIPVLALGGITLANVHSCLNAGASGIAAIRLFQENNIADVAKQLRSP
jgi:thiamine-phosphate pyrophosphorylase